MATVTYDLIGSATATGSSPTLLVSGIPSTYSHLYVVASLRSSDSRNGGQSASLYFNNITTTTYSKVNFSTDASSAQNNAPGIELSCAMNGTTAASFFQNEALIAQYKNTLMYKNVFIRSGGYTSSVLNDTSLQYGLWRSLSAIDSVYVTEGGSLNWVAGSTLYVYGLVGA